jgi:hypothetical protein
MTPGYQAVQSIHALRLFSEEHPSIDKEWYQVSNYLGLLSVTDEQALNSLILKLQANDIKVSVFREPDIANQATAIAIEPCEQSRKLLSNIPNALKEFNNHNRELINKHNYNEQI